METEPSQDLSIQIAEITRINHIIDRIVESKILLKLNGKLSLYVDGRIIKFSELIKLCSCKASFNYRLTFESLERDTIHIIIEFLEIIDWKFTPYTYKVKLPELDSWYQINKKSLSKVKDVLSIYIRLANSSKSM